MSVLYIIFAFVVLIEIFGDLLGDKNEVKIGEIHENPIKSTPIVEISSSYEELISKHKNALDDFLLGVKPRNRKPHYTSNLTMEFLVNVEKEFLSANPELKYFYKFIDSVVVPNSLKEYAKHVKKEITERVLLIYRTEINNEAEKNSIIAKKIIQRHDKYTSKFLDIAYRKYSILDDYGDVNLKSLYEEIERFLNKIMHEDEFKYAEILANVIEKKQPLQNREDSCLYSYSNEVKAQIRSELNQRFMTYFAEQKKRLSKYDHSIVSKMSGMEFEFFLIDLLNGAGAYHVSGTPPTGDQGADIFFTYNDLKVVVQAKRYTGSVGNKAIQEVHSAKGYYKCDHAMVITSSRFTQASYSLANELGVFLISGNEISMFQSRLNQYFGIRKI